MRQKIALLSLATACWVVLAVSIGWYYTVTYFGRVGWPMPSVEAVGALLLYYFSVLNVRTEIQALHWLMVFPLAGFLWAALLPRFSRMETPICRTKLAAALALASLPLSLPLPYMLYAGGMTASGWQFQHMIDVALRRGGLSPWPWLSPMYFALGLLAFGLHLWVLRRNVFETWGTLARGFALCGIAYVLVVATLGTLASYPLRALLE